jgi:hypothetical protein
MELQERIVALEEELESPRQIALRRIHLLKENDEGLASILVALLKEALEEWLQRTSRRNGLLSNSSSEDSALLADMIETTNLQRVLILHVNVTKMDPTLGEEQGRHGSHGHLVRLMNLDATGIANDEAAQDTIMELQDLACEVAALAKSFPVKFAPFCATGLRQRLPLEFSVSAVGQGDPEARNGGSSDKRTETVLIHQVTVRQTAQEDVGFGAYRCG